MTYDDPLVLHSLHQAAATIYANREPTDTARRAAVIEAADLLRLCEEHLRGAKVFQVPEDDGTVWDDQGCEHPDCRLPY